MPASRTSLRSVSLLSACLFAQLGLQFVYQILLARWFGAGIEMDAFQAVHAVPMVVATIVVGSLQYAFVPLFVQRQEQAGEPAAWNLVHATASVLLPAVTLLSLAGTLGADWLVPALFPEFSSEQKALAVSLLRIMSWLTWTVSVTAFLQAVHQAAQVYRPTALAPLVGTLVMFALSFWWSQWGGIHGIAWSAVAGGLVTVALQLPLWWRHRTWSGGTWQVELRRLWSLLWPLWSGAAVYKLDPLVDRYVASGFPPGSVAHLGYAGRLIGAVLTITTNGLAMVVFPVLSRHGALRDLEAVKRELVHALRLLIFLLTPICAALGFFALPVIRDLFERGRFTSADSQVVAALVVWHLGVLVGGSLGEILSKTYFAVSDTRLPTIIRLVTFAVGLVLKLWWGWNWGLVGLVWATSAMYLLTALLDAASVWRKLGGWKWDGCVDSAWRSLLATAAAVGVAYGVLQFPFPGCSLVGGAVGGIVYLVVMWLLGDEFARALWNARRLPVEPVDQQPG